MVYSCSFGAAQRWRRECAVLVAQRGVGDLLAVLRNDGVDFVQFFGLRGRASARLLAVAVLAREGSSCLRSAERLRTAQIFSRHDFRNY